MNKGLLLGKRKEDYILGSSPVVKEEINVNWKDYAPEHEKQNIPIETLFCVSFSALDVLEYLFNWALNNNRIDPKDVLWLKDNGYFKNGLINFNERFIGTLGETTNQGAYQYKIGDAIRKYGLIPQDMFPLVSDFNQNIDKTFITNKMYDLGAEFIKRFPINYEWVFNIKEGLKYAPLQVCVYYADGNGILCPTQNPQHAVVGIDYKDDYLEIDDSYTHQFKKYCHKAIYSAMLYTIKFKNNMFKKEKLSPHIYLINEKSKTKTMIVDFPTFEVFEAPFEEVDSLTEYKTNGSILWVSRILE
jgi:hypothetical protein